jgi:hypothetical protein
MVREVTDGFGDLSSVPGIALFWERERTMITPDELRALADGIEKAWAEAQTSGWITNAVARLRPDAQVAALRAAAERIAELEAASTECLRVMATHYPDERKAWDRLHCLIEEKRDDIV